MRNRLFLTAAILASLLTIGFVGTVSGQSWAPCTIRSYYEASSFTGETPHQSCEIRHASLTGDYYFWNGSAWVVLIGSGTGTSTITNVLSITGGASIQEPGIVIDTLRFCGTGGATATTAHYIGPVLLDDTEADLAFGGAGCDGLDSATETTADNPIDAAFDYKPMGMVCATTGGAALDDVVTFQLREDASDVTGLTCSVTLSGTTPQTCSVLYPAGETVAANSALAVEVTAATDDDVSAVDFECKVTRTFP